MDISTRSKAALGVNYVEKIVNLNDDIMIRIPQENDRGLDIVIEFKNRNKEFYTFSAQVKSGISYFNTKQDGISIASDFQHFKYWLNHNLYIILFVYNPDTDQCYWLDLSKYVNDLQDTKNFRIKSKEIKLLDSSSYQDMVDYIDVKIGDHKRNYLLSKTIRSLISLPVGEINEKLFYSTLNYRNELFLWITVLYKLRITEEKEVIRFLIKILSYITSNPDIWRNKYNILHDEIRQLAVSEFNSRFDERIVVKFLSSFDIDEYCRGQLGQSVFHILELNSNSSLYLQDIIRNSNIDFDIRYKAWVLYPVYRTNRDLEITNKRKWLDELFEAKIISVETKNIFLEKMATEGLFYYD